MIMVIKITQLPIDLLTNILSRLPAKTVVCLKIICKSWRNLISDKEFVNYGLERSIATETNLHYVVSTPRFLQKNDHLEKPINQSCNVLYSADFDSLDNPIELNHPFKDCKTPVMIFGSCRGLFLLRVDYGHLLLYNPTTQTYNVLPPLSVYQAANEYPVYDYGLGYDSVSRNYKCVRIMQCLKDMGHHICEVMVYSMRTNCWKRGPDVPCHFSSRGWDIGILLHERCHWVGLNYENVYELIVAFNLRDEKFSCLPLPHLLRNFQFEHLLGLYVGELDGCLSLSANRYPHCEFWVMKEYGVTESWTKMFTLGTIGSWSLNRPINYSIDKKKLLFKTCLYRLHCFDLETMEYTELMFVDWDRCVDAYVYVENLLMLDYAEADDIHVRKMWKKKEQEEDEEKKDQELTSI